MIVCNRCNTQNREERRFCAACGEALARMCPACSFANASDERFCGGCGRALPEAVPDRPPMPREGYTPRHLVERVLASRHAMEGERKQVTVLSYDMVDSSRLAEQLDPEVMHRVMGRLLGLMAEAVHRYDGTVNQYLGDGIMALFGAPVALEDHAVRAVQAALVVQESMASSKEEMEREYGLELRLRAGLNTGPVVVGRIGDDLRMDYTAVGDTTHLAFRLQGIAQPGTVVIAESTHRLVEGHFRTEPLGMVEIKGRRQPVAAFKVVGRRRRRNLFAIRAERGLTPLVGRDHELALLRECWTRAREGRGQAAAIVGEPGVGKSRLLFEFRRAVGEERRIWLEAHCSSIGQSRPYLPLLDMLRAILRIDEDAAPADVEEKLRAGVRALDPGLEKHIPFLRELFNLPGEDPAVRYLDPQMKRRHTFEALRALTAAGATAEPIVFLYEDLHWIDKASEDYLAYFAQSMAGLPVLLLTTHRPGYVVRWADRTWYTQIALDVMSEGEAAAVVAGVLRTDKVPLDLLARISEKSEGNPLALEEITASLLERGVLVRHAGGVRWSGNLEVGFPLTIQDIVRARIDGLEESLKDTVQIASAVGREFDVRLLTRVTGAPAETEQHLATLKRLELVHETRFFPDVAFAFKHAVIQDVVYQSLLQHRRSELHAAIGTAIEELHGDRLEEHAGLLAHHYGLAALHQSAQRYATNAGDRAARLLARVEARRYYDQALGAARSLPLAPDRERAEIDLIVKLAAIGVTREEIARDQTNLTHALTLARTLGDEPRTAQVLYWLGRIHYVTGNTAQAIAHAEQALAIADRLGDEALAAPPVNLMGRAYYLQSNFRQASRMMERSVEQMRRLGNAGEEATAEGWVGGLLGWMGEFDRGLPYLDHGLQLAREIDNPFVEAAAYYYRGIIHEQRGAPDQALSDYAEARRLAERTGDLFRVYVTRMFEGQAHTLAGNAARGREVLAEAETLASQLGTRFYVALRKTYLANCMLAQGERDTVPDVCREAIALAEETGDVYANALAHRVLADALLRLDPPDWQAAEPAVADAIRVQDELGARPELARSYRTWSRLLRIRGDAEAAATQFMRAVTMFREMRMTLDLADAERELAAR
jgi:class 3 adenylate cyclase/tetratricopeptide (TPR) repeat protein